MYLHFLKEHLEEAGRFAAGLADGKSYVTLLSEQVVSTKEELEILLKAAEEIQSVELISYLMNEKHRRFREVRKAEKFEL